MNRNLGLMVAAQGLFLTNTGALVTTQGWTLLNYGSLIPVALTGIAVLWYVLQDRSRLPLHRTWPIR